MMTASESVRELLERIAAGVGVDARVELEEDAEGVSAKYVRVVIGGALGLAFTYGIGHLFGSAIG